MDDIYEDLEPYGLQAYVILMADQLGGPPTQAACKKYRTDHDIQMPMLYDPTGMSSIYGGMETSMVITPSGVITFKATGKWWAGIRSAIEDVLGIEG